MSIQYPYTLQKATLPLSTQDGDGNWMPGTTAWITVCDCRNEDGRQQKFSKEDGSYLIASHLIQCPAGTLAIKAGEKVRVIEKDNTIRIEGEVLHSSKDRFHTRIWV